MEMPYPELTEGIIGCAYEVYNRLGFGFLECVYEKAMMIELHKAGLAAKRQEAVTVHYDDQVIGEFRCDILVADTVVVELKSVLRLAKAHEVQLVNFLVATHKPVGLLIDFGETHVEVKRKVRELRR